MRKVILLLFLLSSIRSFAQLNEQVVRDAAEQIASTSEETTEDLNPIELENLLRHKIDINSGEYDELVRLQLLSINQSDALIKHIQLYGKLIAIQELQVIGEFDRETIMRILPYISISKNVTLTEGRRELFIRNRKSLNRTYGNWFDNSGLLIKFRYDINQQVSVGILSEKDVAEKFQFGKNYYGLDHYSFYGSYRGSGLIRKLLIGDFRIQYGQGLMAWTGAAFTGATVTGIFKAGAGLSPSVTTDENNYLRGIGISLGKNRIKTDFFFSTHYRDATLYENDSTKEIFFTSFQTTGLHRYTNELSNRKVLKDRLIGTSISYEYENLKIATTICKRDFNSNKEPNGNLYDQFDVSGKSIANAGIDYRYVFRNILFFGEIAMSENKKTAKLNGALFSITKKMTLAFLYRDYSYRFQPVYANPFGAGTTSANEEGFYLGMNYQLTAAISGLTALDNFSFPYLRYRVDKPSSGNDFQQQIDYSPGKKMNIQFRYRYRCKEINKSDEENAISLINQKSQAFRVYSRFIIDDTWDYATRMDYLITSGSSGKSNGMAVSADLFYHPKMSKIKWNFRYGVFYCPDFEARIYQYENDLPGSFSIPFYYGKGNRCYVNVFYSINRSTSLAVRYAVTNFSNGARVADIKFQIRWRL